MVTIGGVVLDEILCVQESGRSALQIPETPMRPHFIKAKVKLHACPDGSHAVFHGPRCIGRYDKKGQPKILRAA